MMNPIEFLLQPKSLLIGLIFAAILGLSMFLNIFGLPFIIGLFILSYIYLKYFFKGSGQGAGGF